MVKRLMRLYAMIFFLVMSTGTFVLAQEQTSSEVLDKVDTKEQFDFYVYKGDLVSLKVYSLTRIAVSNPGIVDIAKADVDEILLIGKTVGETSIFIWDEYGKRVVTGRVFSEDLDKIISRIEKLFADAEIKDLTLEKNLYEGKVVVKGTVPEEKKAVYGQIIGKFAGNVLEFSKVQPNKDMIQIDAQISELTTTLTKTLGFNWVAGSGFAIPYAETLPSFDGSVGDFFKIGDFSRTTAIIATVNALITEGKGRVLSKPSILVTNGQSASFLVGGEIPIRTTTSSSGGSSVQESVTFTSYGVDITVTPVIQADDKIDITLSVSVRDVDAANAVGSNVAFTTRSAQTKLFVDDGQPVVLAGLIKHNEGDTVRRIPFVSDIPIVGALFRSRALSPDQDQEVVISLVPRIQRQKYGKEKQDAMAAATSSAQTAESTSVAEESSAPENLDAPSPAEEPAAPEEPMTTEQDKLLAPEAANTETEHGPSDAAVEASAGLSDQPEGLELGDDALAPPAELSDTAVSAPDPDWTLAGDTQANTVYVQNLQQKIAQRISFPYEAKEKGWTGTVKLTLTILSDGTLNDVAVKESSGHEVFDRDAVNTAKILAPYDPFPAEIDLEELIVTIPIVYSQESAFEEPEPTTDQMMDDAPEPAEPEAYDAY